MLTVGWHVRRRPRRSSNAAWLTYVRSTEAHARIVAIDIDDAKAAPGVIAVFTGDDLAELGLAPNVNPSFSGGDAPSVRGDRHRALRRPARRRRHRRGPLPAADAAELVVVDYDPLPVVVDPEASLRDEVLLFPEAGTNVVQRWPAKEAADFSGCEVDRRGATSSTSA